MTARPEERSGARSEAGSASAKRGFIERGIAAAYRVRSLESRAGSVLSLVVVCALGAGLLAWYYGAALERPASAAEKARGLTAGRAQTEMALPPLLPIAVPASARVPSNPRPDATGSPPIANASVASPSWLAALPIVSSPPLAVTGARMSSSRSGKAPRQRAVERRLAGPTFAARSESGAADNAGASSSPQAPVAESASLPEGPRPPSIRSDPASVAGELAKLLMPATAPAVAAQVLPTRTLLLPKGAFIDCTLETAIDSTLPGMTTCITATDSFGADGKVVLLERGSKLVGETRGEVEQGSSRVFVLWTEARTPTGVVIPLASPGTDELGRAGLPGTVNRHFFQRFGAALLVSIIDAGAQAAAASRSGTVIYSPTASQDVMSEVLKDTLRIAPTVVKHQGDRIQVLVARDLDFRSVYELRASNRGG